MDERAVELLAARYRLRLPRAAVSGRQGGVEAAQAGASLELHDFREYQPGDDLRHLDWNAVARTGQWIVRVHREEVAPRLEVLVDASRSMAVSAQKRERTRELSLLLARVGRAQGLDAAVHWLASPPLRIRGESPPRFDGPRSLAQALARVPLARCGVRVLLSDLLVEEPLGPPLRRLAEGASLLALVQVLDSEDEVPSGGTGARLVDAETQEALDRLLDPELLAHYARRFAAHQADIAKEARRVRALWCRVSAGEPLEAQVRERLSGRLLLPRPR